MENLKMNKSEMKNDKSANTNEIEISELLHKVDHTLLKQEATLNEILSIVDDGMKYNTASVCIPPSYVRQASNYIKAHNSKLKICTVIGFPNGYNTTAVKCFETEDAVKNGADEIDMVINIGWLKDKCYDEIKNEIKLIKASCNGRLLKVIIETCLLSNDEKIKMCEIVSEAGAEFIKTSTGFSAGGATFEDVKLMSEHVSDAVRVKAAGGISSLEDAEQFIKLGADRLGTSRVVNIIKSS